MLCSTTKNNFQKDSTDDLHTGCPKNKPKMAYSRDLPKMAIYNGYILITDRLTDRRTLVLVKLLSRLKSDMEGSKNGAKVPKFGAPSNSNISS